LPHGKRERAKALAKSNSISIDKLTAKLAEVGLTIDFKTPLTDVRPTTGQLWGQLRTGKSQT
jgi:hypothetical protein